MDENSINTSFLYPDEDIVSQALAAADEAEDVEKYFLDFSKKLDKPTPVIYDPTDPDKIIVSVQNLMVVAGEAKSYKSFATSRLTIDFFQQNESGTCIWFDTEQAEWNVANVAQRICRGLGWDYAQTMASGRLKIANLRGYSAEERRIIVQRILAKYKPTFCVIDGIRDLVRDINDSNQCQDIMDDLTRYTVKYGVTIAVVLHTNKDGETLRGHLGAELQNKAETVLFCKKREGGNGCTVSPKYSRNIDIKPFDIEIADNFVPVRVNQPQPEKKLECKTPLSTKAANALKPAKSQSYDYWVNEVRQAGWCGEKTAKKYIREYVDANILIKDDQEGKFLTHYKCLGDEPKEKSAEPVMPQLEYETNEDPF